MLVVSPCVYETLKLYHMHELGIAAADCILAITLKAQLLAIVADLNPEAVLVRALIG